MTEQIFINLLNLISNDVVKHCSNLPGYSRFMYAVQEKRWSLCMLKWWAGWSSNESTETLVRYFLERCNSEDDVLADSLAPNTRAWQSDTRYTSNFYNTKCFPAEEKFDAIEKT
ncbi:hypothetical protein PHMEG_00012467 [Phytophthora megakarya]|uniref:Uncharacterized protein n=1 Tax=Phytophthora megakarya TaxID=4795 RepID=A0A225WA31_9STRA|nr:hypothetical protein PHMEG_00012467 [Phytophthora megakarya]